MKKCDKNWKTQNSCIRSPSDVRALAQLKTCRLMWISKYVIYVELTELHLLLSVIFIVSGMALVGSIEMHRHPRFISSHFMWCCIIIPDIVAIPFIPHTRSCTLFKITAEMSIKTQYTLEPPAMGGVRIMVSWLYFWRQTPLFDVVSGRLCGVITRVLMNLGLRVHFVHSYRILGAFGASWWSNTIIRFGTIIALTHHWLFAFIVRRHVGRRSCFDVSARVCEVEPMSNEGSLEDGN